MKTYGICPGIYSIGEKALFDEEAELLAISNPKKDADYFLKATMIIAKAQLSLK
ncbi:MAG: hypothetical protein H0X29_08095 [Parachlamydiaceae bacterium]|nr:hypothetical protein [Parachlamydiaceae bacterium]